MCTRIFWFKLFKFITSAPAWALSVVTNLSVTMLSRIQRRACSMASASSQWTSGDTFSLSHLQSLTKLPPADFQDAIHGALRFRYGTTIRAIDESCLAEQRMCSWVCRSLQSSTTLFADILENRHGNSEFEVTQKFAAAVGRSLVDQREFLSLVLEDAHQFCENSEVPHGTAENINALLHTLVRDGCIYRFLATHLITSLNSSCNVAGRCIASDIDAVGVAKSVSTSVSECCRELRGPPPQISVRSVGVPGPLTYVVPHLQYILLELLKNSCTATLKTAGNSAPKLPPISVNVEFSEDFVSFTIADEGGGLPADVDDSILRSFWRNTKSRSTETPDAMSGYGVGLPSCYVYASLFGGKLDVRNSEVGVETTLSIPRA